MWVRKGLLLQRAYSTAGPLEGLKVLDLSRVLAGPFCTQLLGDQGADVIKKEGAELVQKLAKTSDIVVENFLPGKAAKFGLDYASLAAQNRGLLYCSISGYGQTGPYAETPAYDLIVSAQSGLMSITGEPGRVPVRVGVALTDLGTGLAAKAALLAALYHRTKTGQGQHIDCSLLDTGVGTLANVASAYLNAGLIGRPLGSQHQSISPYQAFMCSDDAIVIGVMNDLQWGRFVQLIGLPALHEPRFKSNPLRVQNREALVAILSPEFSRQPTSVWLARLRSVQIPCSRINNMADVFADPQVAARGMVVEMEAEYGRVRTPAPPWKMSETPATFRRPPPTLGQHTDEILSENDFSPAEIAALRQAGAVK